jgi:hypothetical protein
MKRNFAYDNMTERYLMDAAIIAFMTIFAPEIIGALWLSSECEQLVQGIRLLSITFLIAIAIVIEISRRKHPRLHQGGYAMAEASILLAIIINAAAIAVPSSTFIPNPFVHIEFRNVSVAHTYTVTINFVNTGATSTKIASVLLNGIPYNDSGWV